MLCAMASIQRKNTASCIFDAFCECLHNVLISGKGINLPGVGSLFVDDRPHKYARNPHTGEPLYVPKGKCVKYHSAKSIKDYFKNLKNGEQ